MGGGVGGGGGGGVIMFASVTAILTCNSGTLMQKHRIHVRQHLVTKASLPKQ